MKSNQVTHVTKWSDTLGFSIVLFFALTFIVGILTLVVLNAENDKRQRKIALYCASADALRAQVEPYGTVCVKREHLIFVPEPMP